MDLFRDLAYGVYWGPFPMIALVGFATYGVLLVAASLALGRRRIVALRRLPMKTHRYLGFLALVLGTLHLLMGISAYV